MRDHRGDLLGAPDPAERVQAAHLPGHLLAVPEQRLALGDRAADALGAAGDHVGVRHRPTIRR
jgi:hypothetical protein